MRKKKKRQRSERKDLYRKLKSAKFSDFSAKLVTLQDALLVCLSPLHRAIWSFVIPVFVMGSVVLEFCFSFLFFFFRVDPFGNFMSSCFVFLWYFSFKNYFWNYFFWFSFWCVFSSHPSPLLILNPFVILLSHPPAKTPIYLRPCGFNHAFVLRFIFLIF